MTKALLCPKCVDIIAPYGTGPNFGAWRFCACGRSASRWIDRQGALEVGRRSPDCEWPLVIGMNNSFLMAGMRGRGTSEEWRDVHRRQGVDVSDHYLFHKDRRDCWALIVHKGDSGDITYTEMGEQP